MKTILSSITLGIFLFCPVLKLEASFLPENKRVFIFTQNTDKNSQMAQINPLKKGKPEEIVFVVRMPSCWTLKKDEEARKNKNRSVRGVLTICTWHTKQDELTDNVSIFNSKFKSLINFADKNDLAIITWSNFGGYMKRTSSDEMEKDQMAKYDMIFTDRLTEWERGIKRVTRKFNLPVDSFIGYGLSGGAQILHRIVLRKPQFFLGVNIHINSSYDIPTAKSKNVLWLVSTGELELGYSAAIRFYEKLVNMGHSVIFKAGENLGHASNKEIEDLALEFFKYLLFFIPDPNDSNWKLPAKDRYYLFKNPPYIGDHLNQVAYPAQQAQKEVSNHEYMVPLPTEEIAKAWGPVIK